MSGFDEMETLKSIDGAMSLLSFAEEVVSCVIRDGVLWNDIRPEKSSGAHRGRLLVLDGIICELVNAHLSTNFPSSSTTRASSDRYLLSNTYLQGEFACSISVTYMIDLTTDHCFGQPRSTEVVLKR